MAEEPTSPSDPPAPSAPPAEDPSATTGTRPDYIPEKFWDSETNSPRLESLAKSYGDLETHSRRKFEDMNEDDRAKLYNTLGFDPGAVMEADFREKWETDRMADRPAAPTDYTFDAKEAGIPDTIQFDHTASDPMLDWWKTFAHEQGFSNDTYGVGVAQWLNSVAAMQPDIEAEAAALGDNAAARIDQANGFLNSAGLTEEEKLAVQGMVTTAVGVSALEKLAAVRPPPNSQMRPGDTSAGVMTEEDLRALQGSKEYLRNDPATVRKVQEGYARLFPDGT